jgi:hypothetical protein
LFFNLSHFNKNLTAKTKMSENYLTHHFIMDYLNDCVQQILDAKNQSSKLNVLGFFTE